MPVARKGPNSVRNGLALSGTVHWMFDRGLLSLDDEGNILLARSQIPAPVLDLLNRDGKARLPRELGFRLHPHYLRFHRENIFKGSL
ncbi:MAG: HNH endonuclease [Hyphomicrobiales bacterium]|nr:HNH endonuclease [Hyphomicrobiales bacterium]